MMRQRLGLLVLVGAMVAPSFGVADEVEIPVVVQKNCMQCHKPDRVPDKPHKPIPLRGVFGKVATVVDGGWVWDEPHLRIWLSKSHGGPRQAVKDFTGDPQARTAMVFPGLNDPAQIEIAIEFLKHYR